MGTVGNQQGRVFSGPPDFEGDRFSVIGYMPSIPGRGSRYFVFDRDTQERVGKQVHVRRSDAEARAVKINKDWAAGRIEVVAENPTSKHEGYYHRRILSDKKAPILPFVPWTSDEYQARQYAQDLASEYGWPVEVWWSHLMGGELSKSFTVKPPKEPSVPGAWGSRVANPARKEVTDRALRYRANATPPPGPRRCAFCGAGRVEVGHVNGHEEDNEPANLIWTCRPCNVRCGNTLRAAGVGRLTRQYNPDAKGAQSLGQWIMAVNCMKGIQGEMTVPAAVAMIRATPPEDRSQFQAEAWRKRRAKYGKSGRQESIPF